jgi:hypothetical protein
MLEVFLVIKATLVWTSESTRKAIFNEADDEFHVKVAESLEEACRLLEVGFEYVMDMDGKKLFGKRK